MRTAIVYQFKSEHSSDVDTFCKEAERRHPGFVPEKLDTDSKPGANLATLYGVTTYPAIVILRNDGQLVQLWQGLPLPLIDEVMAYALE